MTSLASALAKLAGANHPADAFPNTLEPLGRWEYLKQEPINLTQFELNALQNHLFAGKFPPASCYHLVTIILCSHHSYSMGSFYVFNCYGFLFHILAGNMFGVLLVSSPAIPRSSRFLLGDICFGLL